MQDSKTERQDEPRIFGLRIRQQGSSGTSLLFRHTGDFRLSDYEEIELEVFSVRLVRKQ